MNIRKMSLLLMVLILIPLSLFAGGQKDEDLTELNISYVKSPFNLQVMVMKEQGLLEKEFASDGITVNWHEITSGAKQAEAMAAGSLDIASVMNTASVIIANSAGNNVDIIDIVSRPTDTFTIMTGENGPATLAELSGKTVAGPKGTVLHQLLESVIQKEGLRDVSHVSMGLPQAQTALLAGKVDAALLAAALVLKTRDAGGQILTTSEGYVQPLLVSVSPRSFTEAHPDVIERYRRVQSQTHEYIVNNLEDALAIGAAAQDISSEDALDLYNRSGMAADFTESDVEGLKKDIQFLKDLEMIEGSVRPEDLISGVIDVQ
ncbi:MAG: NrtA/SsuA/CpmA family ABC transporter substrate-binding protein [Spirochaetales bacterium]|nr:NrtA/SsuA/CpmA family ABC transporter substrate-binding protein [Spirochaetales bacterium]